VTRFFAVNCKLGLVAFGVFLKQYREGVRVLVKQLTWPNYHDFAFS